MMIKTLNHNKEEFPFKDKNNNNSSNRIPNHKKENLVFKILHILLDRVLISNRLMKKNRHQKRNKINLYNSKISIRVH